MTTITPADLYRMPWPVRQAYERREALAAALRRNTHDAHERAARERAEQRDLETIRAAWANPCEPRESHGVWLVSIGNVDLPFTSEAEAIEFITQGGNHV